MENLLQGWKPDLVCLQETKVVVVSRGMIRQLWGGLHVGWCSLEAEGALGGVLLL